MAEQQAVSDVARLRFLTFWVGERLYALPADEVLEVIRTPSVARVPQAPRALLGLANLRGSVLPVATARGLLGKAERGATAGDRTIVLVGEAATGLAVDRIEALVTVGPERIETDPAGLAAVEGERLTGMFQPEGEAEVARVLDLRLMLQSAFVQRSRPQRRAGFRAIGVEGLAAEDGERLVTFVVAAQEYALPLEHVREVIPAPAQMGSAAGADAVLLGVIGYRNRLLPLLSLRGLLGFPGEGEYDDRAKVLVAQVGGSLVGLVVEQARAVLSADPALVEPAPAILAARTGGEAKVEAIYRADGGRRLISILAPAKLFREDVMARLVGAGEADGGSAEAAAAEGGREQRQYVVFRLGADEFGLPIEAVDEVARAPATVARVPKTPKFLEGVVNLRGEVLPVVDQRRRFDMPAAVDLEARRLIVVRTDRYRAGVIVDSVSQVLRCDTLDIDEAPDLVGDANRLVTGVLNLEGAGRLVMLLDPNELLTRAERDLLDAFEPEPEPQKAGE